MLSAEQVHYIFQTGLTKNEQIEALIEFNFNTRDIQKILRCSPNSISKVKKSINETGSPPPMAKIGRPTKKTDNVASFIIKETNQNPYISASDLQFNIQNILNVDIGQTVLNELRKELGNQDH